MTILSFFRDYYIPLRLAGRSAATVADYTSILRAADRELADVSEGSTLSLLSRIRAKRSAATANKYRRTLVAILRLAVKRAAMPAAPWLDDLPHYPEPRRLPRAWTVAQVERILAEARCQHGFVGEVRASVWWPAIILAAYDSGARIRALLSTRCQDVDLAERSLIVRAEHQKQNADQWFALSDQTTAAIAPLWCPHRELLFAWPFSLRTLHRRACRILDLAGVPHGATEGGNWHKLRRTSCSYIAANGGDACSHLGHSSPAVTRRHYLDPRICGGGQVDRLPRPHIANGERQLRLF